jgi:hypothetical protein
LRALTDLDVISLFVVSFITFADIRNGALILLLLFFFSLYNVTFFILFKLVLVTNFKRKKINYLDYQDIVLVILYENYDDRVYGHLDRSVKDRLNEVIGQKGWPK